MGQVLDSAEQASIWLKTLEQLQAGLMPPLEEERPDSTERSRAISWIERALLDSGHAESYRRKKMLPQYGNLVDHELLFSGKIDAKPFTPSRVWRRSPYIFAGDVRAVGKAKTQNPYTFSTRKSGLRGYAKTSFVGSSVVETIVLNANAEIDYTFDQLTGGAERDRQAADARKREGEKFSQKTLDEAEQLLKEQGRSTKHQGKITQSKSSKASAKLDVQPTQAAKPRRAHEFDPFLQGTDGSELTEEQILALLKSTFQRFASRVPNDEEIQKYVQLMKQNLADTKDPRESLKVHLSQSTFLQKPSTGRNGYWDPRTSTAVACSHRKNSPLPCLMQSSILGPWEE